jgi:predicted ferric reductase
MKNIKLGYGALLFALTLLWLIVERPWTRDYSFFTLREAMLNYTGVIAFGAMSVVMMLAIRPVAVEPLLGGLDKSYRLHKWLGITGLTLGVIHWLWGQGPKWAVGWGWLARPARGLRTVDDSFTTQILRAMRGPAEVIGEWAFYAAAVLIVLALVKRFPYRYFFKTHRVLAVLYLLLAFHSVVLIKPAYWQTPAAWATALLALGGTVGAVLSLTRRIGHQRRVLGRVEALERHEDNHVLKVDIRFDKGAWGGHRAGQFAFVDFNDGEGAHPFTISSGWKNDERLHFHIKELGDYTSRLAETLKVGDPAMVEGPYGCFGFESARSAQIWVGGGIGITPFIARMEDLAYRGGALATARHQPVTLFYSTGALDEAFVSRLRALAMAAKIDLRLVVSGRDAPLSAERLVQEVPEWKESSLWFCGPSGFGHALRNGLRARGFDPENFHQELFDMR